MEAERGYTWPIRTVGSNATLPDEDAIPHLRDGVGEPATVGVDFAVVANGIDVAGHGRALLCAAGCSGSALSRTLSIGVDLRV
jgi:hypothetical protein